MQLTFLVRQYIEQELTISRSKEGAPNNVTDLVYKAMDVVNMLSKNKASDDLSFILPNLSSSALSDFIVLTTQDNVHHGDTFDKMLVYAQKIDSIWERKQLYKPKKNKLTADSKTNEKKNSARSTPNGQTTTRAPMKSDNSSGGNASTTFKFNKQDLTDKNKKPKR
eukprot:scaffold338148_cov18-Prasinocladus_malaysianus.AAC.3